MKSRRSGFTLIELLVVIAIIGILATFLAPSLLSAKEKANKQKCANNLKGVGIALILYSNDYRFFPHMKALSEQHTNEDVSKVYRTLYYFKYIDNTEAYICPSSEDFFIQVDDDVINDPKEFQWGSPSASGSKLKPLKGGTDPDIFNNEQCSYTYLRRKVNASSVTSNTLIGADKHIKEAFDAADTGTGGGTGTGPVGNHTDGFNILYADGHVDFSVSADGNVMRRMNTRLVMHSTFNPDTFSGD